MCWSVRWSFRQFSIASFIHRYCSWERATETVFLRSLRVHW